MRFDHAVGDNGSVCAVRAWERAKKLTIEDKEIDSAQKNIVLYEAAGICLLTKQQENKIY